MQEKFRKLEEKEKKGEDDSFRSKKIHVRSKDPSAIARQFEKGDKVKGKGGKVRIIYTLLPVYKISNNEV